MIVWLVGMPGSGKSTVGRLLASRLEVPFVDADRMVEERVGRSIPEIFEQDGEERFRSLEREALAELSSSDAAVVACGGGAILDASNRQLLRGAGTVVYLRVPGQVLDARLGRAEVRPVVERAGGVEALADRRSRLYEAAAHATMDADGSPEDVAGAIAGLFR